MLMLPRKENKLSKTLQRYENKSKSQPTINMLEVSLSCLRLCKDTKIKANHNRADIHYFYVRVV